jgi:hypothetical protein
VVEDRHLKRLYAFRIETESDAVTGCRMETGSKTYAITPGDVLHSQATKLAELCKLANATSR